MKTFILSYRFPIILISIFFCFNISGVCQTNSFHHRVNENGKLFIQDIDAAYKELGILLLEAVNRKDTITELMLLERKCRYFYSKNQSDSLFEASQLLKNQGKLYEDSYSEAMGNVYESEIYKTNEYYNEALDRLKIAYAALEKDDNNSKRIFFAKSNVLNGMADVYNEMNQPQEAVRKLQQVAKSYTILGERNDAVAQFQYLNYSNIASSYLTFNLDSARFYALRSIELSNVAKPEGRVMITNYYVLGRVYQEEKKFEQALQNYRNAVSLSEEVGENLNLYELYSSMRDIFEELGQNDSLILYENMARGLEIDHLQNKYNSLRKVSSIPQKSNDKSNSFWISILIVGILLIIIFTIIFIYKRSSKDIAQNMESPSSLEDSYNKLFELYKNQDPSFWYVFENIFPNFSKQLLSINPKLSQSEIEFCALLKLNLSSKEIAKYSFIETRTVQNKKYRIRKRLNIPKNTDLYIWFNLLDSEA
ncbi:LuxR C-terminal-related transcriptional regulator [Mangrovimonas futianensis]|uniref:LuxR C-terminal-related transcriptional regulator n=1 Tax=Mangrovimonas futianensis TaxID=2895523 RepID=UPI001E626AB3|nr:LuxR C-terminal-related transcriptional regulator [Mangrovimonas futianensis]MCF1422117.1 LuxR C-terminal-related transcriptional regulator [Mangrovimonas futianensis]